MKAFQVQPAPLYRKSIPVRDPKYLKFIRLLPCIACGKVRYVRDAMHTGSHGLGQKASDLDALPGCRVHHRELHQIGPVKFQRKYRLDFKALAAKFNQFYFEKIQRRVA